MWHVHKSAAVVFFYYVLAVRLLFRIHYDLSVIWDFKNMFLASNRFLVHAVCSCMWSFMQVFGNRKTVVKIEFFHFMFGTVLNSNCYFNFFNIKNTIELLYYGLKNIILIFYFHHCQLLLIVPAIQHLKCLRLVLQAANAAFAFALNMRS